MKKNWWMLGLFFLAACSSDGDGGSVAIATTPLSGRVGGQAWTFVSGATDPFLSEGKPTLFTTLYAEALAGCNGFPSSTLSEVLVELPREPGSYRSAWRATRPSPFRPRPARSRTSSPRRVNS